MITDFGLSKMEQSGVMSTACGTPGYVGESGDRRKVNQLAAFNLMDITEQRGVVIRRQGSTSGAIPGEHSL